MPKQVDAYKLSKQNAIMEGDITLDSLQRLKNLVYVRDRDSNKDFNSHVKIHARVAFSRGHGSTLVTGDIEAELAVICQRCLEPMNLRLITNLAYAICSEVKSDDNEKFDSDKFDLYTGDDKDLDLSGLVEEELLLALPLVSKHDLESCSAKGLVEQEQNSKQEMEKTVNNPFAALKDTFKKQ